MKKTPVYIIIGIILLISLSVLYLLPNEKIEGTLFINEVMSSNGDVIQDEDGDYSDWIEIYYTGNRRINLQGYYLSDNPNKLTKWSFPKVILEPGEHLLVWTSGKNKIGKNGEIHTNFSINSGGEPIYLVSANGRKVLDTIEAIAIPRNRSYGRVIDGGEEWEFFDMPTPGTSNTGVEGYATALQPPTFSHNGGFYQKNIILELDTEEGTRIYYTLDGSEPTEESLLYDGPIEIKKEIVSHHQAPQMITQARVPQPPISFIPTASNELYEEWGYRRYSWYPPKGDFMKGTVVRAKAFKEGALPSQTVTHTYFIDEDIHQRFDLPVISITTDIGNLFDYEKGIYILGKFFDEWRQKNPNEKVLGNAPANYNQEGIEWERPVHIEFYEADGTLGFSQEAGMRIHGGFTRAWAQKTLRLYAKRDYDKESYFNYKIFPGEKKSSKNGTLQQFKRLLLRNSGNDWTYTMFRDGLIQELVKDFNIDTQAYRPAVVYINGEYWGIHNIRERYDRFYFETNYDLDGNNVAIIDIRELEDLAEEGSEDVEHYLHMINFLKEQDIRQKKNYEYVKTLMDIENFIDYQIAGIYIANTDWLQNNLQFWRFKTEKYQQDAPYGQDGRWRWMLFDTDYGFDLDNNGMYQHNTLEWATTDKGKDRNAPEYTFLLRTLLENEEFRNQFINRFADVMNTSFNPQNVTNKIDGMQGALEHEMQYNIQRWVNFGSMEEWYENIDVMRNFAKERPRYIKQHIMKHFGIMKTVDFKVDLEDMKKGTVKINTITIDENTPGLQEGRYWQGSYFTGIPIEVTAVPREGYRFVGWEGRVEKTATLYIVPWEDFVFKPIFEYAN